MENWKDIEGFYGYQISDCGRVRSHNKVTFSKLHGARKWADRIIKPHDKAKDGRLRVIIWKDGKAVTLLVHRIEAIAFLGKPQNESMTVNHKDGNPRNNDISNLEWVTRTENIQHGFENGLYKKSCKRCVLKSEYGTRHEFYSQSAASRFLGRNNGYLSTMLKYNLRITGVDGTRYVLYGEQ